MSSAARARATLLDEAQRHFQEARYVEAAALCEKILASARTDFDALYLLGAIRHAQGQLPQALDALSRALKTNSRSAEVLFNHGMILRHLNRSAEALDSYDRAVALKPDWAEAHCSRGRVLLETGRAEAAISCFETAIKLKPDLIDALNDLGNALIVVGKPEQALAPLAQALRSQPDNIQALYSLGHALMRLGKLPEALASYERAVAADPHNAQAHVNCALVWQRLGNSSEALSSCDRAIALAPGHSNVWIARGNILHDRQDYEEAIVSYDRALAADPASLEGMIGGANALFGLGRLEDALVRYDRASKRDDKSAFVWARRAETLFLLGRLSDSLSNYDRALSLSPQNARALLGKSDALLHAGRPREVLECAQRALAIDPHLAGARVNKALANLLLGNLADGWPDYEYRYQLPDGPRHYLAQPQWFGDEPIDGKTLLIHDEQGLGDSIQLVRYAPVLAERARVILGVRPSLVRLFSTIKGVQLVARGDLLPAFDLHCPLMSLPFAFNTSLETIPNEIPYLGADPSGVVAWRRRLASLPGLKVGLAWAGSPGPSAWTRSIDRRRSLTLAQMSPLARVSGVSFVSLQKGDAPAKSQSIPSTIVIHDWTNELNDLADTAALIDALDLVVSVDTSIVHLAGALGKPVWLLNRFASEWRWLLDREDSPWYPTLRQFRQPQPGDWESVVRLVCDALAEQASQSGP